MVVTLGLHLIAEERDEAPAVFDVLPQHVRFFPPEAADVAQEDRVVVRQFQLQQQAFDRHLGPHARPVRLAGRQGKRHVLGGAGLALHAQDSNRLANRHAQPTVVIDRQRIVAQTHLDGMFAGRFPAVRERDGRRAAGFDVDRGFAHTLPIDEELGRPPGDALRTEIADFGEKRRGAGEGGQRVLRFQRATARFWAPGSPRSITASAARSAAARRCAGGTRRSRPLPRWFRPGRSRNKPGSA